MKVPLDGRFFLMCHSGRFKVLGHACGMAGWLTQDHDEAIRKLLECIHKDRKIADRIIKRGLEWECIYHDRKIIDNIVKEGFSRKS